ncbi:MAG: NAD(P)-binding domain-containing protein [Hyphomicrobiaceae bacterium]|nr:NAD(P)-binding domain-containing protein [Hyphomicrobiaceae bacterium]
MLFNPVYAVYLVPLAFILFIYAFLGRRSEKKVVAVHEEVLEAKLTEPSSLHPKIDPGLCLGCGACVSACPEGTILGLIHNKAVLVEPTRCIGHGACAVACPFDAIELVFGTEKRGIDIPNVGADFQTNVAGIYIAGELGGMGLIRNAIEQGRQAMEYVVKSLKTTKGGRDLPLDVVVIGAGPAGFAASLAAKQHGLRFVTLEQDSFGGTVAHFPRGKLVMTAPAILPLYGKMKFRETTKEVLLELWTDVMKKTGLRIVYGEGVSSITPHDGGFVVATANTRYITRSVLLAIGRRGTPRKLNVPGEEQAKVVYRLIDAEQYRDQHVLVVGGGDSALEAATSIAKEPGTVTTIAYRSKAFSRAKQKNRKLVEELEAAGQLQVLYETSPVSISESTVDLKNKKEPITLKNDAIIVCAGGILPTGFLKETGIEVEKKHGTA